MDTASIIDFIKEIAYLLIVFGVFLFFALAKGKQSLINIILGLYLGLLLSLEFPYYKELIGSSNAQTESMLKIAVFAVFTGLSIWLFNRLMPREFEEKAFEGFGMKMLFAIGGTVLVMVFSYHALPITEFITPGSPIHSLFAPSEYFFWWLLAPLAFLFFL